MADTKLSALTELAATPASDDEVYIRDVSEAVAVESKRITIANLLAGVSGEDARLKIVRKTADEDVISSTTYQNDDHLLFAVGANEVWGFFIYLRVSAASATPDFKYVFALPTGGVGYRVVTWSSSGLNTESLLTTGVISIPASDTIAYLMLQCLYIGGANAGNVQLMWAQDISNAGYTRVSTNSFIIAHKLG